MTVGGLERVPYGGGALEVPSGPFRLEPIVAHDSARADSNRNQRSTDQGIREALDRPIAAPDLRRLFRGTRSVLVAVSDATRKTACDLFLPALLERIHDASRARVSFIVGSGLHRRPTDAEIRRVLGPALAGCYPVIHHHPDDPRGLAELGTTRSGTRVRANQALREHDRIVLTGAVTFHYYAGFTGGRKAVVPGLAARETIVGNHLRSLRRDGARHPGARAGRLAGNPVHRDMADGAALVGPHLLVNSVLGRDGGIERLFVGHWRRAHEAACRYVRRTRVVPVRRRDLVLVSAGGAPYDVDLIQSHKAFEAAFGALRPGGVLVLVAECRRGAGHPDFLSAIDRGSEREMVRALQRDYRVYGQTALSWRRKTASCKLILVSRLDPALAKQLGAEPASDLGEALEAAARYLRRGARGWLIPWGAQCLIESR